ncbi:hypothetical protein N8I77_004405 [Diaporthe amygdali]|uniref:Major facilitator superfamily (MFS) profile domain-containing protein n=1 Tax=Phomopsis amygdali TaxID=1214568 RepID=A0AAD9SNC8_PHOAM|nr:hypothetical protein N8I77_004405 [Diaporthe amygdali]
MTEFNNDSSILATFVVSIYFLGFAFGPLVVAPMSEVYGRVYVYHVGNIAFTSFSIAAACSVNIGMLMAFRFLMGLVGCVPTTIGVGSIVDMIPLEKRGRAISLWAVGPLLGSCVGSLAGGYLIEAAGWRWIYGLLAIMGGIFSILAFLIMRETYAPVLLARKARHLRIESGNSMLRDKFETKGSQHIKMALKRPFKLLLTTPLVITVALFVGIVYGILYLLISTFSFVYPDQYHFDEGTTGLSFLPAGLGMLIGVQAFGHIHDYLVRRARKGMGPDDEYRPEVKLNPWLIVPTGLTLPIGLLIYGWTAQYRIHWIVPMLGVIVFSAGLTGTTMSIQNYQVDSYPKFAASVSAATMLFRSLLGALTPLGGLDMYQKLGLGWGNSLLAFICLVSFPVPVLLYFYGPRLRQRFDPVL